MRTLSAEEIQSAIYSAIKHITFHNDQDVMELLVEARKKEIAPLACDVLDTLILNNKLSPEDCIPLCQDTGTTVIFAEQGTQLSIEGGSLQEIADAAVREAQRECPLRASIVDDPLFERRNTGNNAPAVLHISQTPGETLRLHIAQKGGGAENMSFLKMFSPATLLSDILRWIVDGIVSSGSKACPPLVIGIGIGGNFERCALLAKKALFIPLHNINPDQRYAALEAEILKQVNQLGCGVQGMGGSLTAMAVHILQEPCHIASLPIAVNLQCHDHRHIEISL